VRSKIGQLVILLGLSAILCLGMVLVASSYPGIGVTCEVGTGGLPLAAYEGSGIPQSVIEDATEMARTLFGDSQEKANNFVNQVLAVYSEAKDKDFVILFNSGGWGWNLLEDSRGWESIFDGIKSELNYMGYQALVLDYKRTEESWRACLREASEIANFYPSKAEDLACRVEFLTKHLPDLKVIVAGESNGTVIADKVMTILRDNRQVYSIQTGPPFWHKRVTLERALVLTSNGVLPDTFSQGDLMSMIAANLRALFGLSQTDEDSGTILRFLRAPGHDYWWQHPSVSSEITNFLKRNFGINWR